MIDSTEPAVLQAGLEVRRPGGGRLGQLRGRRRAGVAVHPDHAVVLEHGAAVIGLTMTRRTGPNRGAEVRVADRLIADLTGKWGMREDGIMIDCLTFPIATGQEETRRDGIETIEAIREVKRRHPEVQTTLGLSNICFGSTRRPGSCSTRCSSTSASRPAWIGDRPRGQDHADGPDPGPAAPGCVGHRLRSTPAGHRRRPGYDPLQRYLELFEGVTTADTRAERAAEMFKLPVAERLQRRIVDGEGKGLGADLDLAMADGKTALEIINTDLLAGMKVVGELFGSGQMQLPFVLQSAEVMKTAVAFLDPRTRRTGCGASIPGGGRAVRRNYARPCRAAGARRARRRAARQISPVLAELESRCDATLVEAYAAHALR